MLEKDGAQDGALGFDIRRHAADGSFESCHNI